MTITACIPKMFWNGAIESEIMVECSRFSVYKTIFLFFRYHLSAHKSQSSLISYYESKTHFYRLNTVNDVSHRHTQTNSLFIIIYGQHNVNSISSFWRFNKAKTDDDYCVFKQKNYENRRAHDTTAHFIVGHKTVNDENYGFCCLFAIVGFSKPIYSNLACRTQGNNERYIWLRHNPRHLYKP